MQLDEVSKLRTFGLALGRLALFGISIVASAAQADTVAFAPQYTGAFSTGGGASASFYQIDSNWHGSTELWNQDTGSYGSGVPIGTLPWGTGIWGQADWTTVQQAAAGQGGADAPPIIAGWSGVATSINDANELYNTDYSSTWGPAALVPFFDASQANVDQQNWTSHFTGYIRVTEAGSYNFSVLNDDGFFLTLTGGAGATLSIGRDYLNPRDRDGFASNLLLSPGLYGFDLGMWNRLEAGVVDLRWLTPDSNSWVLVPTTNLLPSTTAVPEPGIAWLMVAGLAGLGARATRRRPRARGDLH